MPYRRLGTTRKRPPRTTARNGAMAGALAATLAAIAAATVGGTPPASAAASYDETIVADRPVAFFDVNGRLQRDKSGRNHPLSYVGRPRSATLPNGASAMLLDGEDDYAAIGDRNDLSIGNRVLTIEAWMRVDDPNNEDVDNGQYVHWLGKGEGDDQEYAMRLYNENTERSSRISSYVFNPGGGIGSGSYFQDDVRPGVWMHVGVVFDGAAGRVTIYRDGRRRDSDSFDGVDPRNGDAPLRIGTRQRSSYFQGAIGKVAVYDYDASSTFQHHIDVMRR